MGHRGIYKVTADGERASYYTHWGAASVFSVFRRLQCAVDLKQGEYPAKNMADIFEHLGVDGNYIQQADSRSDLMFERLSLRAKRLYDMDFENNGYLEMRITLNMDTNTAFIEHNPRYGSYKYVGNFYIPIDQGLYNLNAVLDYAEKANLDDIMKIAATFERHTWLSRFYDEARALYGRERRQKSGVQNPHDIRGNTTSSQFAKKLKTDELDLEPER